MTIEYVISIDGCPYVFGTSGCPTSITSTDPSWSADWKIAVDVLEWPAGAIRYSIKPDGDFSAGGLQFVLHDLPAVNGPYDGNNRLITKLLTRHATRIQSTFLTSAIVASSSSFDVAHAGALTLPGPVWIDGECINCDAASGSTVPIVERGYLGSRQTDHVVDPAGTEVWAEFPYATRRRCLLWVIEAGVARVKWRGYLEAGAATLQKGSDYVLPAKHVWTYAKELDLGVSEASPRVFGYDTIAVRCMVKTDATLLGLPPRLYDSYFTTLTRKFFASGYELAAYLQDALNAVMLTISGVRPGLSVTYDRGVLSARLQLGPEGRLGFSIAGEETWVDGSTANNGANAFVKVEVKLPPVCRFISLVSTGDTVEVDDVSDLPSSWTARFSVEDGYESSVVPVLRSPISDEAYLIFAPSSTSTSATPPTITGRLYLRPRRAGTYTQDVLGATYVGNPLPRTGGPFSTFVSGFTGLFVTDPLQFTLAYEAFTQHWLYGLRCNVINDTAVDTLTPSDPPEYLATRLDPRDWDWSGSAQVVRHTAGAPNATRVYFDGKTKVGSLVTDLCLYNGCAVAVRGNGQLAIVAVRPPLDTDTVTATITGEDYADRGEDDPVRPTISEQSDALINKATIETPDASVRVTELRSQRRYGPGRDIRAQLTGVESIASLGSSPATIAASVSRRLTGLWSEPVQMLRFALGNGYATTHLGDIVSLSGDWCLPDGLGGRGISSANLFVCGITEPFADGGIVTLETWRWTLFGFAGYAPAGHVESIATANVTLSRSFLTIATSTKNYDGSDPSGGDGGASFFKPGDKVAFLRLDTTATTYEGGYTVLSVAGRVVTLTTPVGVSPDWTTLVGGGAWVDLIPDVYSAAVATQKEYAYTGAPSGGTPPYVIGGTADEARRWSP